MRDFKEHRILFLMSSKETKNKCHPKGQVHLYKKTQNKDS